MIDLKNTRFVLMEVELKLTHPEPAELLVERWVIVVPRWDRALGTSVVAVMGPQTLEVVEAEELIEGVPYLPIRIDRNIEYVRSLICHDLSRSVSSLEASILVRRAALS